MKLWSFFTAFIVACWRGLTRLRVAVSNLLFLAVLALTYFLLTGDRPQPLPERAALLLNPIGTIVDEKSFIEPLQGLLGEPSPADHEVQLRDLIAAIELAADDPRINTLVMNLDQLLSVGLSKTQEIARALLIFKQSGKPVIAVGDNYSQDQYLLASYADTIILHPRGTVGLEGYSSYQNYFREALEKLSVNMHVFKAGEHKSVAEHFERDDMSAEEKQISGRWLSSLWRLYTETVEQQRSMDPGAINAFIESYPSRLRSEGGDMAATSLSGGLVDELLNRTAANSYLLEVVGAGGEDDLYEAIPFEQYLAQTRPLELLAGVDDRVAVLTAQGNILNGDQAPGNIGGDSLARLIRSTAREEGVAAIVLRINSGGGSVFASEVIRQEILNAKASGLPVVISMGAVAASGGYYIAAQADQIWATPGTITGSIGVFAAFPTIEQLLDRGGIHTDGVGTTALAGSLRLDRPLDEKIAQILTSSVNNTYRSFLDLIAQGRGMSVESVDAVAQGRVWSAEDARDHGLVDELGGLHDAIDSAASLAGLEHYEIEYVELPLSPRDMLLQQLSEPISSLKGWVRLPVTSAFSGLAQSFSAVATELSNMNDPTHLYARCFSCGVF
jgi:protease IV